MVIVVTSHYFNNSPIIDIALFRTVTLYVASGTRYLITSVDKPCTCSTELGVESGSLLIEQREF